MTHHVDLTTIVLAEGAHKGPTEGVCLLEAVAWFAGEPFSDHPTCVSPVLGAFGRSWNDALDNDTRQRLVPYIPRLVGTAGDPDADERRAWMGADWLVRTFTPAWLRKGGHADHAAALEALPELTTDELAEAALPIISAAESAARSAAESAAWSAARSAAESAARSAARSAAESAARSAAENALADTVKELQESAFGLLDRMIEAKALVPA